MPRQPKPSIKWDPSWNSALQKAIKIALAGGKGPAKKKQAQRILSKMDDRGVVSQRASISTGASKIQHQFQRSQGKRKSMQEIAADAKRHSASMKKNDQKWDGSVDVKAKRARAAAAKRQALAKKRDADALRQAEAREKGRAFTESVNRQLNLIDVSQKKGQGIYKSTTGRTKYVGAEGAAAARSKAGGVAGGLSKRIQNINAKWDALDKIVRDPKASRSKRLEARRAMREHEAQFGRPTRPKGPNGGGRPKPPEGGTGGVKVPRKPKSPRSPQGARK